MGRNATISIEACDGRQIVGPMGYRLDGGSISLGSLQFGQSKDAVIQVNAPPGHQGPFVRSKLTYDGPGCLEEVTDTSDQRVSADAAKPVRVQELRLRFVELAQ